MTIKEMQASVASIFDAKDIMNPDNPCIYSRQGVWHTLSAFITLFNNYAHISEVEVLLKLKGDMTVGEAYIQHQKGIDLVVTCAEAQKRHIYKRTNLAEFLDADLNDLIAFLNERYPEVKFRKIG